MSKKKRENTVIKFHQHIGPDGKIFGKAHPIDSLHKKESTLNAHNYTIEERSKKIQSMN